MNTVLETGNKIFYSLIFLILALLFYFSYRYVIPTEDSVILYDYSKHLATQGVITYGNANYPIEGATDFLWMALIALFKLVGLNEFASAQLFNFLAALLIMYLLSKFGVKIAVAFVGLLATPYLYSALNGFSTLFFAAAYLWCLYLALNKKPYLYLSLLVLCLIRPDGVVWGFGLVLFRFLEVRDKGTIKQELIQLFVQLVIPGSVYFFWRAWYFSEWLPLPFIVKSTGSRDWIFVFKGSVKNVAMAFLPGLLAGIFIENRRLYFTRMLVLFLFPVIFYCGMRLEQNLGNRFLAPLFFGSLVLVSFDKRIISLYSFILLSVLFSWFETSATIQNLMRSSHENIYYISRELAGLHGKLLTSEAGRLGYYSGWLTHDSWGLNTPNYAHHMINRNDLEQNNYDLIVGHCNLEYLVTDVNPLEHQDRSLDNHCIALVSYIKSADYKIFLVPYLTDRDQDCNRNDAYGFGRYDIYAISNRYEDADELANILTKHGAKQFPLGDDFYINTKYNKLCLGKPG